MPAAPLSAKTLLTPRVAGFRSEYPAGFKLECMAGFVGTRNRLVGGKDAVLVIDAATPKKGDRSVGVDPQYASSLGKTANCQTLVSLTLARGGAGHDGITSLQSQELDE